jgi:hypothetical protein
MAKKINKQPVVKVRKEITEAIEQAPRYNGEIPKADGVWQNRVLFFTPSRGTVRVEWMHARYGQAFPTNWSMVDMTQYVSPFMPLEYTIADAQNLMAKVVVEQDYQWVIYIEDDNIIPPDLIIKFNQYMLENKVPVVSGLYFTKSDPPEPLIYRGLGNSYYQDWKLGDKVWADGIPFGCRLEHAGLIKEAWKNSPEYVVNGITTRRVFDQPNRIEFNQERGGYEAKTGTTDLAWCKRIMDEKLFTKIGFPEYDKMKYPFLVDTSIFVWHVDPSGRRFPLSVPKRFKPDEPAK